MSYGAPYNHQPSYPPNQYPSGGGGYPSQQQPYGAAPPYGGNPGYAQGPPSMQQYPPHQYPPQQYPPQQYAPQQYPPQQYPPQQYPPQQYPPQQYPPQQYPPQQAPPQQAPPPQQYQQQPFQTFTLQQSGKHTKVLTDSRQGRPVLTIQYKHGVFSSGPDIEIFHASDLVGSVRYHTFTSKIDLAVNGYSFTYRDEFDSNCGLGHVQWQFIGSEKDGDMRLTDRSGNNIIIFNYNGPKENPIGTIEIWAPKLSNQQLNEIFVSAIGEIEQMEQNNRDGEINYAQLGALNAEDNIALGN